ncbi:MAG TPA: protein kinase, partial [Terriglobales bacterium]|nr:protein kinase [Terriglobales bacterium]
MSTLSPKQWRELAPLIDKVLEMSEEERAAWLSSLRETDPRLAEQLASLAKDHNVLASAGFMEGKAGCVPSAASDLSGQTVGPYKLLSIIGQGGMGSVWLAERSDGRFERRVAVKFVNIALIGQGNEARFKREGSILARLAHPHIAALADAGVTQSGFPYLVLEYV